jgi:S1-C subfamily serine protease
MGLRELLGPSPPGLPDIPQLQVDRPMASPERSMLSADAASRRLYEAAYPAVVKVQTDHGSGSGFFVDGEGHVVTAAHVVLGTRTVAVVTSDGRRHHARIEALSDTADLAELSVEDADPKSQKYLELETNSELKHGQTLAVLGHARGSDATYFSAGSFKEEIHGWDVAPLKLIQSRLAVLSDAEAADMKEALNSSLIETKMHVEPGDSGAPLLDAAGKVVGVTALSGAPAGRTAYFRPVEEIKELLDKSKNKFQFIYGGDMVIRRSLDGSTMALEPCPAEPSLLCANPLPSLTVIGGKPADELQAIRRKDGSTRPVFSWTTLAP